jgi:hypothetical protein
LLPEMGYRRQSATGWFGIATLTLLAVAAIALTGGRARRRAQPTAE